MKNGSSTGKRARGDSLTPFFRCCGSTFLLMIVASAVGRPAWAALDQGAASTPVSARPDPDGGRYTGELSELRGQILTLESGLMESLHAQRAAKANLKKLKELIELRRRERELGRQRMRDLEETVGELESRRGTLASKIKIRRDAVRRFLIAIENTVREPVNSEASAAAAGAAAKIRSLKLPEQERLEAPRRKLLRNLILHGLQDLEVLKADMDDANHLQDRIEDEKQQLAYLFQDLDEKESVLELNRQMQADLFRQHHDERVAQLENYRRLKSSQAQVEQLIQDFNARLELERTNEAEKALSRLNREKGGFVAVKGRLQLPVEGGKVISGFGKAFDPRSRLFIFKKGIDVLAGKSIPVRAIYPGKIAFSGELPDYGQVAIIDHGDHYYSLCAHLGQTLKHEGDSVEAGDTIGATDPIGTPIYFEIRSRNVAVNPLQWLDSSISLE